MLFTKVYKADRNVARTLPSMDYGYLSLRKNSGLITCALIFFRIGFMMASAAAVTGAAV